MTFGRMDIVGEDLLGELTPSTKPMAGTQGYPNIFGVMDKENNKCPFLEDDTNNIARKTTHCALGEHTPRWGKKCPFIRKRESGQS